MNKYLLTKPEWNNCTQSACGPSRKSRDVTQEADPRHCVILSDNLPVLAVFLDSSNAPTC